MFFELSKLKAAGWARPEYAALLARVERMRTGLPTARIYFGECDIQADVVRWSDGLARELPIAEAPGNVASISISSTGRPGADQARQLEEQ
jgi:hypothetical protein